MFWTHVRTGSFVTSGLALLFEHFSVCVLAFALATTLAIVAEFTEE